MNKSHTVGCEDGELWARVGWWGGGGRGVGAGGMALVLRNMEYQSLGVGFCPYLCGFEEWVSRKWKFLARFMNQIIEGGFQEEVLPVGKGNTINILSMQKFILTCSHSIGHFFAAYLCTSLSF